MQRLLSRLDVCDTDRSSHAHKKKDFCLKRRPALGRSVGNLGTYCSTAVRQCLLVYPYQAATAARGIRATVERCGSFDYACGAVISAGRLGCCGSGWLLWPNVSVMTHNFCDRRYIDHLSAQHQHRPCGLCAVVTAGFKQSETTFLNIHEPYTGTHGSPSRNRRAPCRVGCYRVTLASSYRERRERV